MCFFLKSQTALLRFSTLRRRDSIKVPFIFFCFLFGVIPLECECQREDKIGKVETVRNIHDITNAGDITVQSNLLAVGILDKNLEERPSTWKNSLTQTPEVMDLSTLGRIENEEKNSDEGTKNGSTSTTEVSNEENENSENPINPVDKKCDADDDCNEAEVDGSLNEFNDVPSEIENDFEEEDTEQDEESENDEDPARSSEENKFGTGVKEKLRVQSTKPPRFNQRPKPTPTLKPLIKTVRTTYPFLKKVPSRLVAVQNQKKPLSNVLQTQPTRSTPASKLKYFSSKRPVQPIRTTTNRPPRPATPMPENYNPHHPHGIVVFDKRKRRPKPGRTTVATTTTTRRTSTTQSPAFPDYEYVRESGESLEVDKDFNSSSPTGKPHKPTKTPLSKLAMAMIASSTSFDNGTTDDLVQYPKTPVNLLHLLQAYTKQMQLADGDNKIVETLKQPVRTTPFMLHLNQLNFAAKLGISVYYSLIAIIPLIYLAFGGIGRIGFLNGLIGKKKRKKRSYKHDDDGDSGSKHFNRTNHFLMYARSGGGSSLKRMDLRGEDHEEEFAWILGKISEIILEFSSMTKEGKN